MTNCAQLKGERSGLRDYGRRRDTAEVYATRSIQASGFDRRSRSLKAAFGRLANDSSVA